MSTSSYAAGALIGLGIGLLVLARYFLKRTPSAASHTLIRERPTNARRLKSARNEAQRRIAVAGVEDADDYGGSDSSDDHGPNGVSNNTTRSTRSIPQARGHGRGVYIDPEELAGFKFDSDAQAAALRAQLDAQMTTLHQCLGHLHVDRAPERI